MVFKKDLTPLTKKGSVTKHAGKGSTQEVLPNRHAVSELTRGNTANRTMNDYAKATPLPGNDNDADDFGPGPNPGI